MLLAYVSLSPAFMPELVSIIVACVGDVPFLKCHYVLVESYDICELAV